MDKAGFITIHSSAFQNSRKPTERGRWYVEDTTSCDCPVLLNARRLSSLETSFLKSPTHAWLRVLAARVGEELSAPPRQARLLCEGLLQNVVRAGAPEQVGVSQSPIGILAHVEEAA